MDISIETKSDYQALPLFRGVFKLMKLKNAAVLAQILVEAYTNAVRHGNRKTASKKVRVAIQVDQQQVMIRVRDEGKGFQSRTGKESLWRTGGRGLALIRHHAKSVRHWRKGKFHTVEIQCSR